MAENLTPLKTLLLKYHKRQSQKYSLICPFLVALTTLLYNAFNHKTHPDEKLFLFLGDCCLFWLLKRTSVWPQHNCCDDSSLIVVSVPPGVRSCGYGGYDINQLAQNRLGTRIRYRSPTQTHKVRFASEIHEADAGVWLLMDIWNEALWCVRSGQVGLCGPCECGWVVTDPREMAGVKRER